MNDPRETACRFCLVVGDAIVAAHEWICRQVCGHVTFDVRTRVPQKIRDASHDLSNAATALQGSARRVSRDTADVLGALARDLRDDTERRRG